MNYLLKLFHTVSQPWLDIGKTKKPLKCHREREREADLVDARDMEDENGGGGSGADEEGGDGEGFERHEVGVAGVAFSEGRYGPPQLGSTS